MDLLVRVMRAPLAHPVRILTAALALAAGLARPAHAVSVSPTALYIDSRTRTAVLTLYNPGSLPEEITVDFAYGFPQADSAGNVSVALTREPGAGEPSALAWMRAFPRRLLLQPGQRQVVRVLVEPPAGLADGEYWARVLISSRGGQPPIEQTQGDIRLQLNVQTTLVMAANYRKGELRTGVNVTAAAATRVADGVQLQIDLARTGNAAYLGRMRAELLDASGAVLTTLYDDLAVYRTMRRRLTFPVAAGTTGPLVVRIHVDTEREDLPPGGALPAAAVDQRIPVT
jgi:P pilus assembly chaperone PapD